MDHFCGTHDPDFQDRMGQNDTAAEIWRLVQARLPEADAASAEAIIYDCTMEAVRKHSGYEESSFQFEDSWVEAAIRLLYKDPERAPFYGLDRLVATEQLVCDAPIGTLAAHAYFAVVKQRALQRAKRWIDGVLRCMKAGPGLSGIDAFQAGLLFARQEPGVVREQSGPIDIALYAYLVSAAAQKAVDQLHKAAEEVPGATPELAGEMVGTLSALIWALQYGNYILHNGEVFDSLQGPCPHIVGASAGSYSLAIVEAFAAKANVSDHDLARAWLEACYFWWNKNVSSSKLGLVFLAFQTAIGLQKVDYCHKNKRHGIEIIPQGLRQCLLEPRMSGIRAELEAAAAEVTIPKGLVCPDPAPYAQAVRLWMDGAVWGLELLQRELNRKANHQLYLTGLMLERNPSL